MRTQITGITESTAQSDQSALRKHITLPPRALHIRRSRRQSLPAPLQHYFRKASRGEVRAQSSHGEFSRTQVYTQ